MSLELQRIRIGEPINQLDPTVKYDNRLAHDAVVLPIDIKNRELPLKLIFSQEGRMDRVKADGVLFPPDVWDAHSFVKYTSLFRRFNPDGPYPNWEHYRDHTGWVSVNGGVNTRNCTLGVDIIPGVQSDEDGINNVARVVCAALDRADYLRVGALVTRPLGSQVRRGYSSIGLSNSFLGTILGIDRYAKLIPAWAPTVQSLGIVLDVTEPCYENARAFSQALERITQKLHPA